MKTTVVRTLLALAVAFLGVSLPTPSDRLLAIRQILPTEMLDTSRTFTLRAALRS
jgi:hypothetical protein